MSKREDEKIASIYYSEGDLLKRVDFDRTQFDELYATNPQLATYASAMLGDAHFESLTGRKVFDEYWADYYSRPHVEITGFNMMTGAMTNTNPKTATQTKADLVEIEKRVMAWWIDRWHEEMMRAIYGVNRPANKSERPLDTGRNPAKSKTEKENK